METIKVDKDIRVFYVTAKSFPYGIMEAHEKIHSLTNSSKKRRYFGLSWPEKGVITYKAAAEEKSDGEGKKLNCESFVIKSGTYTCETINDFTKDVQSIGKTFQTLLSNPDIDPKGYCLEWYLNEKDVRCMVKLKS